jgi:hypothetical protein
MSPSHVCIFFATEKPDNLFQLALDAIDKDCCGFQRNFTHQIKLRTTVQNCEMQGIGSKEWRLSHGR